MSAYIDKLANCALREGVKTVPWVRLKESDRELARQQVRAIIRFMADNQTKAMAQAGLEAGIMCRVMGEKGHKRARSIFAAMLLEADRAP